MHRQFFLLLALTLGTAAAFARRCTVREDFNPATDSLEGWGTKTWRNFTSATPSEAGDYETPLLGD